MWWRIKRALRAKLRALGLDVSTVRPGGYPFDFDDDHIEICRRVAPYTMTSFERVHGLVEAVKYVVRHRIDGAIVECGVYKGGSMMAVALTLQQMGCTDRDLFLFDTYRGMTAPTEHDTDYLGRRPKHSERWAIAPLAGVQEAMRSTGYPSERVRFVEGPVEVTLPHSAPERIALLRLDTDFYDSTKHELVHLYPRLADRGVLIIDDYGLYRGARLAVDEYFAGRPAPLLSRMDFSGRLGLKLEA